MGITRVATSANPREVLRTVYLEHSKHSTNVSYEQHSPADHIKRTSMTSTPLPHKISYKTLSYFDS